MRKRSELFFNLFLLPIDFAAMLAAFVVAYAIRVKIDARPVAYPLGIEFFLQIFLLIIPVIILIFALTGLYNLSSIRGRLQEAGKIFVAVSGGLMFMIMVDFFSISPIFPSKSIPFYAYGISLVTVTLGRQIVRSLQRALFRRGIGTYRVVVVGSGPIAANVVNGLKDTRTSGYQIVGAIDSAKGSQKRMGKIRVDRNLTNLVNRLGGVEFDEIIQADSSLAQEEILELVTFASNHHLTYRFVPNQLGIYATHSTISTMAGMPMVEIKRTPLDGWGRIVKRAFDLTASGLALIILTPLFTVIGLIIKLIDPGPVFYKHKRLSREGKYINVYKFRTMKAKYCTGPGFTGKSDAEVFADLGKPELTQEFDKQQKLKDDPRVSPVGRFLRRTSLDELAQLFNVVKGDLSLVGPRPIVQAELDRYGTQQSKLLSLRPGVTGWWQISGRSDIDYDERVKLDMYYVENWSFWLDIKIILRTVVVLIAGRGAY
ncbi:MAG TPA: sugar transferase [Candidatus Dormibacteraeota bacterium]|nr:sugar transferase [Candidatus Dormibacteraeota bacterium]